MKIVSLASLVALAAASSAHAEPAAAPPIGVANAHAFRWSDAPDLPVLRLAPKPVRPGPRLAPLSFDQQLGDWAWRVVHLPVVGEPETGWWARGALAREVAMRQPGLKVLDPNAPDAEALCFTLITCLMDLDAWSQAHPDHAPLIVVLEARGHVVRTDGRVRGALARVRGAPRIDPPAWDDIAEEVALALPPRRRARRVEDARGKLLVIATGAAGAPPADAPFLVAEAGDPIALMDARAAPIWALRDAKARGVFTGVLHAGWERAPDAARIGAREAHAGGADFIVLSQEAARTRP